MDDSSFYSDSTTTITTTGDASAFLGFGMAMFAVFFVFFLVIYAVYAYLLSRVFKKAGVKPSIAWIPVYSSWKMLEIGGQQGFWAVLAFIPLVNIASMVYMYIAMYHIGKKLGKEDWFIAVAIFAQPVWLAWLAFDSSQWNGGNNMGMDMNNTQPSYAPPVETMNSFTNTPTESAPVVSPISDINPVASAPYSAPEANIQPDATPPVAPVDNNFQQ